MSKPVLSCRYHAAMIKTVFEIRKAMRHRFWWQDRRIFLRNGAISPASLRRRGNRRI
jgi:hypothetical protein